MICMHDTFFFFSPASKYCMSKCIGTTCLCYMDCICQSSFSVFVSFTNLNLIICLCMFQSLQALKKISQEHPTACLRAGALMAVLSYLDFFSTGVQVIDFSKYPLQLIFFFNGYWLLVYIFSLFQFFKATFFFLVSVAFFGPPFPILSSCYLSIFSESSIVHSREYVQETPIRCS